MIGGLAGVTASVLQGRGGRCAMTARSLRVCWLESSSTRAPLTRPPPHIARLQQFRPSPFSSPRRSTCAQTIAAPSASAAARTPVSPPRLAARPAGFCSPSASANSRPRPALSPRAPYDAGAISIAVTTLQSTPGCAASNPGSQEQADPLACSPPLVHLRAFHPSALPLAHRGCSLAALVSVHTSTHHSTRSPDSSLRSIASRAHDKVSLKLPVRQCTPLRRSPWRPLRCSSRPGSSD